MKNPFHKATTVFIMSLCGSGTFLFHISEFFSTLTDLAAINRVEQGHFSQPTLEQTIILLRCPHRQV